MRTKHRSFELEKTLPGTFLAQGWLGGILTGFVYTVVLCLSRRTELSEVLLVVIWLTLLGTGIGIFKSTMMWLPYHVFKIQVRAITRVAIASSVSLLLAWSLARMDGHFERRDLIEWMLTWVMAGLPTAIVVGSSIKPWELFTFGSIAGQQPGGVLRTFATLPLRFLSLLTLAAVTLYFARQVHLEIPPREVIAAFCVLAWFLLFTAYVSFRSPRKVILCGAGVIAILLVALTGFFTYVSYFEKYVADEARLYVVALSAFFVIAWAIFLAARLSVPISNEAMPLNFLINNSVTEIEQSDHHCLGSRFVEWQERVA